MPVSRRLPAFQIKEGGLNSHNYNSTIQMTNKETHDVSVVVYLTFRVLSLLMIFPLILKVSGIVCLHATYKPPLRYVVPD